MATKQKSGAKMGMPAWLIVVISVAATLVVVMLVTGVFSKERRDQMGHDWDEAREKMDEVMHHDDGKMHEDGEKMMDNKMTDDKMMTESGTTSMGQEQMRMAEDKTTDEVMAMMDEWSALNCLVTNLETGAMTWYETSPGFDEVRFENAKGGMMVMDKMTYVWDYETMTGMETMADIEMVREQMMETLPASTMAGDYEIVCGQAMAVNESMPAGVMFEMMSY